MSERTVSDAECAEWFPLIGGVIRNMRVQRKLLPEIENDDAWQVGRIAVWQGLQSYRPDRCGGNLSAYLGARVARALLDHQRRAMRAHGFYRHHGRVAEVYSYDGLAGDAAFRDVVPAPNNTAAEGEARASYGRMRDRAATMREPHRTVAFNLLADQPLRLREIGERFGFTESRASQITEACRKALAA